MDLPPHLFSVGAASYTAMLGDSKNQSIIISGESGAGKTEATKRILTYFAGLQGKKADDLMGRTASLGSMGIEDQILRANPILEGFGNAKTVRNDNSSRFGKFIDIEFDTSGKLRSAKISNYLLEKSRIVTQQPNERNYHAFYMMCAGAASMELNSLLCLHDAMDHNYVCTTTQVEGVNDSSEFQEMMDCMNSLGFSGDERDSILKITAAVLHLGDLEFEEMENSDHGTRITDQQKTEIICKLMQVEAADFTKIYQYKTLEDPFTKKIIDMPQNPGGASDTRHSMAKCLYSRLFDWLVWRINESTKAKQGGGQSRKIGILDIYGFEVFEWNSFEQLCINFANEKLQQHFNSHMFTLEQQLYNEEGISWSHIVFQDNREIIDSLEKKPLGLFCIIDSECLMPNGKDATCLNKVYTSFKTSKIVYKPSRFADTNFAVAHYAGPVIYDIVSFLEKNTDKLHADIINLGKGSKMPMLKALFSDAKFAPELRSAGGSAAGAKSRAAPKAAAGSERAKQHVTVSMMFRSQLDQLVEDLNQTNPRYVRCIKPNGNKAPHDFDSLEIQRQLRCAGMLESIRIRRAGYSVRRPFKEFFNRFRILTPTISAGGRVDPDFKALCASLLQTIEARFEKEGTALPAKSWQIGRSKIFMKDDMQARLEKAMTGAIQEYVVRVQRRLRGWLARRRFKAMRRAAAQLQSALRTLGCKCAYKERLRQTKACIGMQAALRMLVKRQLFSRRRAAAVLIQRRVRGWATRRKIGKLKGKNAAERIKRQREEEEQRAEMDRLKKAQQEKEREMEEMRRQMEVERQQAQEEAERRMSELEKSIGPGSPLPGPSPKDSEELEKLRQETPRL
ncbi:unnamed protein product [Prorocentrum cordatum]|uniref:Myosin motor domain-containing protein n=1 Tax=Prorocentrum cordatum TaxID=2364126 RepID=A0ABN9QDP0_9DINO|nr:unnamed protein product [Polarella glacialis]